MHGTIKIHCDFDDTRIYLMLLAGQVFTYLVKYFMEMSTATRG